MFLVKSFTSVSGKKQNEPETIFKENLIDLVVF